MLLIARLALSLAYSVANPLGEAPDEADHYAYAAYIGNEGRLPAGFSMTQSKHPPLYHLLAAAAAAPFGHMDTTFLRSNPDVGLTPGAPPNFFVHTTLEDWPWRGGSLAMHVGRLISVAAGVALTLATFALGRRIFPAAPLLGLAAATFVAFLPEGLFIGGSMSNDTLAALWSTLGLWAALAPVTGPRRDWLSAAAAGVFMGLAFVTKASTVGLWPVIVLAMSLTNDERPLWRPAALARPAAAAAIGLLIAAPWLLRNWQLYGDPMGTRLMLATIDQRHSPLGLADLWWLARGWFFSFWGKFGGAGQLALPWPFYAVWGALLGAAVTGWLRRLIQGRQRQAGERQTGSARPVTTAAVPRSASEAAFGLPGLQPAVRPVLATATPRASQPAAGGVRADTSVIRNSDLLPGGGGSRAAALVVLLGAPLMAVLAIVSYSQVALGTDQGRLLFPALAPLALLLAGGLAAWLPGGATGARYTVGANTRFALSRQGEDGPLKSVRAMSVRPYRTGSPAPNLKPTRAEAPASPQLETGRDGATRGQAWMAAGMAGLMGTAAVLALIVGLVAPFGPPPAPDAGGLAAAQPLQQRFGQDPALVGLHWGAGGPAAATPELTLYWQAQTRPQADLRTDLRVVGPTGDLVWEWKRSPAAGRFSTDRWRSGQTVADVYQIPTEAMRQAARIEIGLRPFPDGPWLLPAGQAGAAAFFTLWEAGQ